MKKLFIIALCAIATIAAVAGDHSTATIRAEYKYEYPITHSDSLRYRNDVMALQIAPDESRYFSIKTEFFDSLTSTPGGRQMIQQLQMDALNNSGGIKRDANGNITAINVKAGAFDNVPRRGVSVNVYKHPLTGTMTVFDAIDGPENTYYTYEVPMDDLVWEPGDSTATFLDYECQNATADYHGRRWTAWFAIDIPVSEGPWQLHGLPGLILMAESDGGEYRFTATGLYECTEPINDMPGNPDADKTTRKEFLKIKEDFTKHPSKAYGIIGREPPMFHDLIETDYKD